MSAVHPAAPLLPASPARAGDGRPLDGAGSLTDRLARRLALRLLSRRAAASSSFVEGSRRAGASASAIARSPLRAVLRVRSPRFYRQLLRGSVGLGESYMDGLWDCDDLVALTRIAARNVGTLDRLRRTLRAAC